MRVRGKQVRHSQNLQAGQLVEEPCGGGKGDVNDLNKMRVLMKVVILIRVIIRYCDNGEARTDDNGDAVTKVRLMRDGVMVKGMRMVRTRLV